MQVRKFYNQVLNREPDDSGWHFLTDLLNRGMATLGTLASSFFESIERLDPIVQQMYHDYLFRVADAGGLAFWRGIWQQDGGPERVTAGIVSSPEFFNGAGGTNTQWVTEMDHRLLSREPDTGGHDFWTSHLNDNSLTRPDVVYNFVRSDANERNLINGWYHQYLNRDPLATELAIYLAQLKNGQSQRGVQIQIINSPEYFNSPPPPAAGTAQRVNRVSQQRVRSLWHVPDTLGGWGRIDAHQFAPSRLQIPTFSHLNFGELPHSWAWFAWFSVPAFARLFRGVSTEQEDTTGVLTNRYGEGPAPGPKKTGHGSMLNK